MSATDQAGIGPGNAANSGRLDMFTMARPREEWHALGSAMRSASVYIEMTNATEHSKSVAARLDYGAASISTMLDCDGWRS